MCHAEREEVYAWIAEHGGTPDAPETLREKVRAARTDARLDVGEQVERSRRRG